MKLFLFRLFSLLILVSGGFINLAGAADGAKFVADIPLMKEEAVAAGLVHQYTGGWEFFVGGGAASFDCNGDRLPDLFIAGGESEATLFVNRSKPMGKLRFSAKKLAVNADELKNVAGAYPVNLDNDDHIDLVVLRVGKNLLLKGGADCSFSVANSRYSFDGSDAWSTAFSAIWEKGNAFATLAFGNYVDRNAEGSPWGTCHDNRLVRSKSDTGLPDYSSVTRLVPGYCALSMMFTDWNKSGESSLRIANDRQYYRGGREQLWQISKSKPPHEYTENQGWKKLVIWGMGLAQTDLNGDNMPEYAISSMGDVKLQSLENGRDQIHPDYQDIALEKQVTAQRPYTGGDVRPSTSWHVQFADFNNDGRQDLFIAKGNVEAMKEAAAFDPDNMLLQGTDHKFHEFGKEAGIALKTRGRGAIVEDFNADGMLDLLVVNRKANVSLFRNLGARTSSGKRMLGNWIGLELDNGAFNKHAIGAKITVKTDNLVQTRTLQIGGGHASGQSGFAHFGLGSAKRASIQIEWPDGTKSIEYQVLANNFLVLGKASKDPLYWYPTAP